jgi:Tol biopolymer transport system component
MSFGKSRVQYSDFYWTYYRFKNYDVYFYVGGKELAGYVGEQAQNEMDAMEKILDYRSTSRFQIIVYNKLSDLKQTNIGLELDDQANNIGGVTRIIGNKMLIYFDGNHLHFHEQMRAGMARVLLDQLMYGGNVRERLQASILLNLPDWFTQGLVTYLAKGWTVEDDNKLRDAIMSRRVKNYNKLLESDAAFAGQSFWKFIVDNYGEATLSNLLYMTRINRSLESGFLYVLGSPLKKLSQSWQTYYMTRYENFEKGKNTPADKPITLKEKKRSITQLKLDPFGSKMAYVVNKNGKFKVKTFDFQTAKKHKVEKGGYVSLTTENDKSYPVLAWHPSGKLLATIKERKGKLWLNLYNVETKKSAISELIGFSKVMDMNYSPDGSKLVFAAIQRGQSDLFLFNIRGRNYDQLTNDIYDDLYPHFDASGTKIYFASNRSNDTMGVSVNDNPPQHNLDLFMLDTYNRRQELIRITQTPENEMQPMASDSMRLTYLSDKNGVVNRFIAEMDSTISFVDTTEHYRYYYRYYAISNFNRNIDLLDVSHRKNKLAEVMLNNGKHEVRIKPNTAFDKTTSFSLSPYQFNRPDVSKKDNAQNRSKNSETVIINFDKPTRKDTASSIDVNNYVFQSEFKARKKFETTTGIVDSLTRVEPANTNQQKESVKIEIADVPDSVVFRLPKQRNYDISFSSDYLITQLDNSLFNATYQPFTGGAVYFDPGLNGLFKIGMSDVLNDYKLTGAARIGFDFNSNEYMLILEMLKRRIDKQFIVSRQSKLFQTASQSVIRTYTYDAKYVNKLPFSEISSVRGTLDFRMDRSVFVSTDVNSLQRGNVNNYWCGVKGEYIFDNTVNRGLNLLNGTRLKIFAEAFRKLNKPEKTLLVIGGDIRYYQKIHRQIIWANRLSASTSIGKQKLLYYLGSQDNVLVPGNNFNNNISIDQSEDYVFQTLASPMRGFKQNIRNGSSFALFNSEIRIPFFQYLLNRPIRSDFIRNFQTVFFVDAGTAWTGISPFAEGNNLNEEVIGGIDGNPVTVTVIKQIQPVVGSYGFGLRSRLFGYFVRADWGYGIDDKQVQKPLFNLSLGLDF